MTSHSDVLRELERIKNGDVKAFTRIYDLYWRRIFGFSYRMLNDQEMAEDITHETFLVLLRYPERFNLERASLLTFLCAIARNHILKYFRRKGYEVEIDTEEQNLAVAKVEDGADPLAQVLEQELFLILNEAMALLPVLQREVIVLREIQELSYEEIAVVVGVELNVVKARLHRARQALAKRLAPYMKRGYHHEMRRS